MPHIYVRRFSDGTAALAIGHTHDSGTRFTAREELGQRETLDRALASARHRLGERHAPIIVMDESGHISIDTPPSMRPTRRMKAVNPSNVSGRLMACATKHVAEWQRGTARPPFLMTDAELMGVYNSKDRPRIHIAWNQAVTESGAHRVVRRNPRKHQHTFTVAELLAEFGDDLTGQQKRWLQQWTNDNTTAISSTATSKDMVTARDVITEIKKEMAEDDAFHEADGRANRYHDFLDTRDNPVKVKPALLKVAKAHFVTYQQGGKAPYLMSDAELRKLYGTADREVISAAWDAATQAQRWAGVRKSHRSHD